MKKFLLTICVIVSSFFFINNAKAQYYDNNIVNSLSITNSPIFTINKVTDGYSYNVNNSYWNNKTVTLSYGSDGIYANFNTEHLLLGGSLYLNTVWLLTYNSDNGDFILYTYFLNNASDLQNMYFDIGSGYNETDNFDLKINNNITINVPEGTFACKSYFKANGTEDGWCGTTGIEIGEGNSNISIYGSNVSLKSGDVYLNDRSIVNFEYDYNYIRNLEKNVNFQNAIEDIYNKFESQNIYDYYVIYSNENNSIKAIFYNDYDRFYAWKNTNDTNYTFETYDKYRLLMYRNLDSTMISSDANYTFESVTRRNINFFTISNNVYANNNNSSNINDENPYFFFYDSNNDINHYYCGNKCRNLYDLTSNHLLSDSEGMPLAKYINLTPEISFATQLYKNNDDVYKVDLTIDYKYINNNKYFYLYSLDNGNSWVTNVLDDTTSYTLEITKNTNVIARIVDMETYNAIDTKTFVIDNIETGFDISFISEELKDEYNNTYQTNVTIDFNSLNRNLYDYEYRSDYYVLDNNEFWTTLDSDKSSQLVQLRNNISVYARIKDKSNGNVLYSETFVESRIIDKPKITFKSFNNLKYLGGADVFHNATTIVESVDLTIDFGYVDNEKYYYMYKTFDNTGEESGWTTTYLLKNSIDLNFTKNTNVVAQVYDRVNDKVLTSATFVIDNIYNESTIESTNNFIDQMSDITSQFMGLFDYLFNGLNPIIRTCIISLFTILIACTIIKLLRRK